MIIIDIMVLPYHGEEIAAYLHLTSRRSIESHLLDGPDDRGRIFIWTTRFFPPNFVMLLQDRLGHFDRRVYTGECRLLGIYREVLDFADRRHG